jgi:hypothetical protein
VTVAPVGPTGADQFVADEAESTTVGAAVVTAAVRTLVADRACGRACSEILYDRRNHRSSSESIW